MLSEGLVTIFNLSERKFPDKFYKTQAEVVSSLLANGSDCLYAYETFQQYYIQIMGLYVEHLDVTQHVKNAILPQQLPCTGLSPTRSQFLYGPTTMIAASCMPPYGLKSVLFPFAR